MSRPESFTDCLIDVAWYLDILDSILTQHEVKIGDVALKSTGNQAQLDLRKLADHLPVELDQQIMAILAAD